ncbi:hypothetical protein EV714DRAFT_236330 [Schizophyllum commune]
MTHAILHRCASFYVARSWHNMLSAVMPSNGPFVTTSKDIPGKKNGFDSWERYWALSSYWQAEDMTLDSYASHGADVLEIWDKVPRTVSRIWTVSSCVCDALISFSMTGLEHAFSKDQEYAQAPHRPSIQTGTVTTVVMVAMFVMYETADSKSQAYIACELALGPLYVNVMLYVLNDRERMAVDTIRCNSSDIELPTSQDPTSTQDARAIVEGSSHVSFISPEGSTAQRLIGKIRRRSEAISTTNRV